MTTLDDLESRAREFIEKSGFAYGPTILAAFARAEVDGWREADKAAIKAQADCITELRSKLASAERVVESARYALIVMRVELCQHMQEDDYDCETKNLERTLAAHDQSKEK